MQEKVVRSQEGKACLGQSYLGDVRIVRGSGSAYQRRILFLGDSVAATSATDATTSTSRATSASDAFSSAAKVVEKLSILPVVVPNCQVDFAAVERLEAKIQIQVPGGTVARVDR